MQTRHVYIFSRSFRHLIHSPAICYYICVSKSVCSNESKRTVCLLENGLPIVNRRHVGPSTLPSHERSPSTPPVIRTRVVRDRLITQMLRETNLLEHEEKFVEHAVEMRHMLGQSKQELEHFLNEVGIKALGPRFAMITCTSPFFSLSFHKR